MKSPFLLLLLVLLFFSGFTQVSHQVVIRDAVTLKPVPYATVKILHKEGGTYANEAGKFDVRISEKDSLLITCVGYESIIVFPLPETILLKPVVINLGEVRVNAKKDKEQSIGYFKSKTDFKYWFRGNRNYELVLKISIPGSMSAYRIRGVKLNARNTKARSLARLHIYNQNPEGLPGKELLNEDIIINKRIGKNYEIDLSYLNLVLNERVLFVGIEAIQGAVTYLPYSGDCIGFGLTFDEDLPLTYNRTLLDPNYLWRTDFSEAFSKDMINKLRHPGNLQVSLILD